MWGWGANEMVGSIVVAISYVESWSAIGTRISGITSPTCWCRG